MRDRYRFQVVSAKKTYTMFKHVGKQLLEDHELEKVKP
jgi:hypothetical protein